MVSSLHDFWHEDESGQGLSEYGMIIALVCLALVAALILFKDKLVSLWTNNAEALPEGPVTSSSPSASP